MSKIRQILLDVAKNQNVLDFYEGRRIEAIEGQPSHRGYAIKENFPMRSVFEDVNLQDMIMGHILTPQQEFKEWQTRMFKEAAVKKEARLQRERQIRIEQLKSKPPPPPPTAAEKKAMEKKKKQKQKQLKRLY
jgi:hypothetical protein